MLRSSSSAASFVVAVGGRSSVVRRRSFAAAAAASGRGGSGGVGAGGVLVPFPSSRRGAGPRILLLPRASPSPRRRRFVSSSRDPLPNAVLRTLASIDPVAEHGGGTRSGAATAAAVAAAALALASSASTTAGCDAAAPSSGGPSGWDDFMARSIEPGDDDDDDEGEEEDDDDDDVDGDDEEREEEEGGLDPKRGEMGVTIHPHPTPVDVAPAVVDVDADDSTGFERAADELPIYTSDQVRANDGSADDDDDGNARRRPIWMTYGGIVYDVTEFVPNHPGGGEKIMLAAGSAIEPYWHTYRQHYASDLPMRLMEELAIGRLAECDQNEIDDAMERLQRDADPYENEPERHSALLVHSDTPMNAEVPVGLLTTSYLTPASLFYIRHHHPVPLLSDDELRNYEIEIDLTSCDKGTSRISLHDIRTKLPKIEIVSTLQCSGNRRSNYNDVKRTSGTPWVQGAISTATWGGARLRDVLSLAGIDDPIDVQERLGVEHVVFEGLDGMAASIGIEKALSPYGDVLLAYEMDGRELPRDHGRPVRLIVPGYAAVRSVKWVNRIELSRTEAEGPWQRGLNYKALPPNVTDAMGVDLDEMPSMMEGSVYSGISRLERVDDEEAGTEEVDDGDDDASGEGEEGEVGPKKGAAKKAGDKVAFKASGWAWAGGGRNVVRVDVTGDGGQTWTTAAITDGKNQKFGRAWAWVFWTCDSVNATVREDGTTVEICSKAVDSSMNVQPERSDPTWNVRGLGCNSWYRSVAKVNQRC